MKKLEDLKNAMDAFNDLTSDEQQELGKMGYNVNTLSGDLWRFWVQLTRKATIRQSLRNYSEKQRKALHGLAAALKIDTGPDYRHNCQLALMDLLGLDDWDADDAQKVLNTVTEGGALK